MQLKAEKTARFPKCSLKSATKIQCFRADCSTPVGAISKVENDRITLSLSADCKKTVSGTDEISNRIKLAKRLVSEIE